MNKLYLRFKLYQTFLPQLFFKWFHFLNLQKLLGHNNISQILPSESFSHLASCQQSEVHTEWFGSDRDSVKTNPKLILSF